MRRIVVADFSGLEKYLDDDKSHVKIPVTDCLLVDDCAHSVYQTLAIVKAGGRMLLLGKCGTGHLDMFMAPQRCSWSFLTHRLKKLLRTPIGMNS